MARARRPAAVAAAVPEMDPAAALRDVHVLPREGNHWQHVAQVFGRLVAQGLMEADKALAPMVAAAAERFPQMDPAGRQMRLAHALRDAEAHWVQMRDRTRFAIRRALQPLLAERASSARLLVAAREVNGAAGGPLLDLEVLGEVRREVYWAARRAAGGKGRA
jgi:hypothetical protein